MSRQDKYKAILFVFDDFSKKILEIDREEKEDVKAIFKNNELYLEANTIGKLRGLINSYLRLLKVIMEVSSIGEGKNN